jgi:hypothetical protein
MKSNIGAKAKPGPKVANGVQAGGLGAKIARTVHEGIGKKR